MNPSEFTLGKWYRSKSGQEWQFHGHSTALEYGMFATATGSICSLSYAAFQSAVEEETGTFIVWGPSGTTNPRVKFKTFKEADYAARQMTIMHKQMFYAMKAVSKYEARVTVNAVKLEV